MLAKGIKNRATFHAGKSTISIKVIILYTGIIAAHHGLPAFTYILAKQIVDQIAAIKLIIITVTNAVGSSSP